MLIGFRIRLRGAGFAALCALLAFSQGAVFQTVASAQSFVIGPGVSVSTEQALADGQTGVVEAGGEIDTTGSPGDNGVSGGDATTVLNAGRIAGFVDGVSLGDDALVHNSGVITSLFDDAIELASGRVVNSGALSGAFGVFVFDGAADIRNSGEIDAADIAILLEGDGPNFVLNSGAVRGGDDGVLTDSSLASTILNYGLISGDDGIDIEGAGDTTIVNAGAIIGTDDGIDDDGDGRQVVVNSGLIATTGAGLDENALDLGGGDDVLILQPGSEIVGGVEFGAGDDRLEVTGGLNAALALDNENGLNNFLPETVALNGLPGVFSADERTFATVDPTAFLAVEDMFGDVTGALSRSLAGRETQASGGATAVALSQAIAFALDGPPPQNGAPATTVLSGPGEIEGRTQRGGASALGGKVWADAFGGLRSRSADGVINASDSYWAGAMVGADFFHIGAFSGGGFLGVMGGSVESRTGDDERMHRIDLLGPAIGLYGSAPMGDAALDLALMGGANFYASDRTVAGPAGRESAKGDFTGLWIAPEATLSTSYPLGPDLYLRPSANVGYAGMFLDGFTEQGSSANVTVDARQVHLLRARLQASLLWRSVSEDGLATQIEPRLGVRGYLNAGDDASGVLLAQAIDLDPKDEEGRLTGFAGLRVGVARSDSALAFFDLEGGYGAEGSASGAFGLGLRLALP